MRSLFIVIAIGTGVFLLSQCVQRSNEPSGDLVHYDHTEGYIGEEACKSCHETEYNLWSGSHHDWAMKIASMETVLGNFNDQEVILDGVSYHFTKDGEDFVANVNETDGSVETYVIDYTFGVTPLQQYITRLKDGKHQVLRASWDSKDNKWFHQYKDQKFQPNDWLHWTQGGQRWNTMCAECHSTDLKKNYDWMADTFHTTWSSINVSCEACHGPGKQHVDWAEGPAKGTDYYVIGDSTQRSQIDHCGPCHSRRAKLTQNMEPGKAFEEQYLLQTATPEFYHPDGQIMEEDYVIGSFLQSKMYNYGVKCSDCHNSHSMELKLSGNDLCMQCHDPKFNSQEHHFHPAGTESALCVNCHMTGQTYMGNDFRRDHSFRIPRPDQSVEFGTPNACTGCHTDQSDEWAADNIIAWYGDKRPEHYSDALLLTTVDQITAEEQALIQTFINNPLEPFLTRATAIDNYTFNYSENDFEALVKATKDDAAMVRYKALMKFMQAAATDRHTLGIQHLDDPARIVRIAAAQLTLDMDASTLLPEQRSFYKRAQKDHMAMLKSNLDFPLGRLQFGDYYFRKDLVEKAIEQYEMALKMDSLLTLVYPNLATAYSRLNMTDQALATLNTLLALDNQYGRGYYLRGLLQYQLNNESEAIHDFGRSIELDRSNFRAYYNLATLYYQKKEFSKAEKIISDGLAVFPASSDGKYLLALIYQEQGREADAKKIMDELNNTP